MKIEQPQKNKFMPQGKSKLVKGTLLMPELANLCLVLVPSSENGKPEDEVHDLLDKKWKNVKAEFKGWFAHHIDFKRGSIHSVQVQSDVACVHMLCFDKDGKLDEKALEVCMKKVSELAKSEKASVHVSVKTLVELPQLEQLTKTWLLENGINCYFYEESDSQVKSE